MLVVWSPAALRQVARNFAYLAESNPQVAERVAERLIAARDSLAGFAQRGRPSSRASRRQPVAVFQHVIRSRIVRDEVRILRVRHTARRPTGI